MFSFIVIFVLLIASLAILFFIGVYLHKQNVPLWQYPIAFIYVIWILLFLFLSSPNFGKPVFCCFRPFPTLGSAFPSVFELSVMRDALSVSFYLHRISSTFRWSRNPSR